MRFTVSDRGRGIPPEQLEAIFERFRQVDASDRREKGGTGLGLAIARAIVDEHRGRIWAESRPGAGTSFQRVGGWEVVPAATADEAEAAARAAAPDVVLLDVMMPDVDGPATLERLRPLIGDAPVIFLTAKTQQSDLDRLRSLGAAGVIAKPFDPMALPGEVAGLVG